MKATREDLVKELGGCGIRPSVQRVAIMEYIRGHLTHPTVDEIYEALREAYPTLSRTTVYNTLKLLVDNRMASQIETGNGYWRFDGNPEPHGHFVCNRCGQIIDFPISSYPTCAIDGAEIQQVDVCARGLCRNCIEIQKQKIIN